MGKKPEVMPADFSWVTTYRGEIVQADSNGNITVRITDGGNGWSYKTWIREIQVDITSTGYSYDLDQQSGSDRYNQYVGTGNPPSTQPANNNYIVLVEARDPNGNLQDGAEVPFKCWKPY